MAAVSASGPRRSLIGSVLSAAVARSRRKGGAGRVAAAVADNMLTVCALGAAVADGFLQGGVGWGLGVLVPALLVLDFKIRG